MLKVTIVDDYKNILKECFESDNDFVSKWHNEAGNGLESCINKTYSDLKCLNLKFYSLYNSNDLVGYFGKELVGSVLFLTGFFIKPEYRNNKYIKIFWDTVHKEFEGKTFFVGIYDKNIPAKKFLIRNGLEEFMNVNVNNIITIIFRFKGA